MTAYKDEEGKLILDSDVIAKIIEEKYPEPSLVIPLEYFQCKRMIVDEGSTVFGSTSRNELINGKAAIIGILLLIDFELLTGKGLFKGTGFLVFVTSSMLPQTTHYDSSHLLLTLELHLEAFKRVAGQSFALL